MIDARTKEVIANAIAADERGDLGCFGDDMPIDTAIRWGFLRRNFNWSDDCRSAQYAESLRLARLYHASANI